MAVLIPAFWWGERLRQPRVPRIGDGEDARSYGFPLDHAAVDLVTLVGGHIPRDGIPTLTNPGSVAGAELPLLGRRFLLPNDPVVGIAANGEAKAYPLRVLVFHEVVNDHVGGNPILVVHQPLCGFTGVFSRRLANDAAVFGVSGLVWNSCGVLYQLGKPEKGLYLPLLGKAITGPAAAQRETLELFPFTLTSWQNWQASYPETSLLRPDMARLPQYKRDPYSSYLGSELLRFPVRPLLPPEAPIRGKSQLLVLWPFGDPVVIPLEKLSHPQEWVIRGARLRVTPLFRQGLAELRPFENQLPPYFFVFAFSWFAAHPEADPQSWMYHGSNFN